MIKIISGVYGYMPDPKAGTVYPKTSKDAPFVLTPEQEARLVGLGVAEYVEAVEELPELPEGVVGISEYNVEMKASELREIGAMMGLEFPANAKKQDMVKAMDEFLAENMEDGEELPEIDPAEAVE